MLKKLLVLSLLVGILLSACNMSTEVPVTPGVPSSLEDSVPPEVLNQIKNQVSQTLGVSVDKIQIDTIEQREWSDSCLGLGGPEESCAQVVTPGWLVAFSIDGQQYRYRVDEKGTTIRQEP